MIIIINKLPAIADTICILPFDKEIFHKYNTPTDTIVVVINPMIMNIQLINLEEMIDDGNEPKITPIIKYIIVPVIKNINNSLLLNFLLYFLFTIFFYFFFLFFKLKSTVFFPLRFINSGQEFP